MYIGFMSTSRCEYIILEKDLAMSAKKAAIVPFNHVPSDLHFLVHSVGLVIQDSLILCIAQPCVQ